MPGGDAQGPDLGSTRVRRTPLIAAAVVAVASVVLACLSWSGRDDAIVVSAPETAQLHRLNVDQAACLRFAIIIRRSEAEEVTLDLSRYGTLDPHAGKRIVEEIAALDELGPEFPAADYWLIRSFADTADASARVLARNGYLTFRDAVTRRSQDIAESAAACQDRANFDVETLEVG